MTPAERFFEAMHAHERAMRQSIEADTAEQSAHTHDVESAAWAARVRAARQWDGFSAWLRARDLLEGAPKEQDEYTP